MSVTGDTATTKQKMEKPLQLVCNKDGKLQLNPEALKVLQSIEVPMIVVAVVGAARTGKTYLMDSLAGEKKGFSVNSTVQAHAKGIWMWCRSLPQRPNEVLLLLDPEGLGDPEKGDIDNDHSIYSLAILLSSILIYNGKKQIDQQSLQELHYVTELSKWILKKSQPDDCDSLEFVSFFPEFVWVIRDWTLDMNIDGKDVTPNEYLEHSLKLKDSEISEQNKEYNELHRCIRDNFPSRCCFAFPIPTHGKKLNQLQELEDKDLDEDFVKERQKLINYIHTHKKVKRVLGDQLVTGRRFVELTKAYMGMMADGVLPCMESCVAKLMEVENQAAVDEALKLYDDEMKNISDSGDLTMNNVTEYYNIKSREALNILHKRSMNSSSNKHIQQLKQCADLASFRAEQKPHLDQVQEVDNKPTEEQMHASDISGQDFVMTVTRDTAATKQKMEKPLQLVCNKDGKLQLNPEALKVLQSIEDPMVVVTVVGAARTGKSYLMNCLAGDKKGFSVNSTVQAHAKGIWMWCRSLPQRPNEVLLLLDPEGLGDPEKGDIDNDHSIYSLAILLSSILIYNGLYPFILDVAPSYVTELSKWILKKSQPDDCDSLKFVSFFPEFVWVIRDLTLDLNIDGKDMTPHEYLEHSLKLKDSESTEQDKEYNELRKCIRNHFPSRYCFALPIPTYGKKLNQLQELEDKDLDEDFVQERQKLINYIHTHKKVKRVVGGQLVTGRRFVELTKAYMGMMADGVLPCMESCVAKLMEVENQAAVDEALKFYDDEMKNISDSGDLSMNNVTEYYNIKSREALNIFHKRSMNSSSNKHIQQLKEKMCFTYKSLKAKIKEDSQEQCKAPLAKEMSSIKKYSVCGHDQGPGSIQKLKAELDKAIKEHDENTKDEMEGCADLASFQAEQKPHLDQVQEADNKPTKEQMHASALEEELSRVKCEMEKMAQEKKADEEHRKKEIMKQIRKRIQEDKMCSKEELKKAMEHTRSEIEKYKVEGRMEDIQRALQRYDYLEKKYEEASKWSFMKFIKESVGQYRLWMEITG